MFPEAGVSRITRPLHLQFHPRRATIDREEHVMNPVAGE